MDVPTEEMTMDRKWWTLTAVGIGVFMLLLDITIVNVALPDIETALHASFADLQWVIDAYALTLAALLLTAGSLADRLGRKRVFVVGTAIFTLGSLLCGLATGPLFLSLSRAAQGVGGATMFATSLALLASAFQGRERGVAFGVFGAVTGVAVAVGPVIGGVLVSLLSWRWIFFVNVPVGIGAIVITVMRVAESREPSARRLDVIGFLTFSVALAALIFGLIRSNGHGWGTLQVGGSLVVSAVLLVAFVLAEWAQRAPMLDLSLLRKPTFSGGLVAAFAISAGLFSLLTYLVLYLQDVLGYSAIATGTRLLVLSGAIFVASAIAGRLTTRVPTKLLIAPGFVVIGAGLMLMRGLSASSHWTHLVPGLVAAGIGAGLVNAPVASTAVGVVEPQRAGMASGINSTFRQVGIATGIAALGAVFTAHLRDSITSSLNGTPLASTSGALANAVTNGQVGLAIARTPAPLRPTVADAARVGFVNGLNDILLIGALLCFGAAVACFALIRQRDFTAGAGVVPAGPPDGGSGGDLPVPTAPAHDVGPAG
jgi:EmrB/QacA subfamily drug resistance transporter